jgi:prepilin-type N-terminal cleavage/methylation domain-containing protein
MNAHSQQQVSNQSSQDGFTIVECLLAIILVSILLVAVAPVLVLATANRVQAKRVELATNAAKAYVDRIRAGAYNQYPSGQQSEIQQIQDIVSSRRLVNVPTPASTGNLECAANDYCTQPPVGNYLLYCVDGEGDGACTNNSLKDMIIQVSAYQPNPNSTPSLDEGYELGIRVYRADGFADTSALKKSISNASTNIRAQATTFTGGLGDRKAPQYETQIDIVTDTTQYSNYCSRIGGC